jgi:hypothetical protein
LYNPVHSILPVVCCAETPLMHLKLWTWDTPHCCCCRARQTMKTTEHAAYGAFCPDLCKIALIYFLDWFHRSLIVHFFFFFFFFWQYWGLNSGPTCWVILPAFFCEGFFFEVGSGGTICPGWLQTAILLISAS